MGGAEEDGPLPSLPSVYSSSLDQHGRFSHRFPDAACRIAPSLSLRALGEGVLLVGARFRGGDQAPALSCSPCSLHPTFPDEATFLLNVLPCPAYRGKMDGEINTHQEVSRGILLGKKGWSELLRSTVEFRAMRVWQGLVFAELLGQVDLKLLGAGKAVPKGKAAESAERPLRLPTLHPRGRKAGRGRVGS